MLAAAFGEHRCPQTCVSSMVLQEAYFPEEQLWLADYPYVDRDAFLELSFQIEAERAAAAADAASPMAQPLEASPYL